MKERGAIAKKIFYYSFIIVFTILKIFRKTREYNFMFIICNEHGNGVGRKSMIRYKTRLIIVHSCNIY